MERIDHSAGSLLFDEGIKMRTKTHRSGDKTSISQINYHCRERYR